MNSDATAAIVIRPAARADIPAIARLSRDYIEYGLPWRWRPEALFRCMDDEDTVVVGAFDSRRTSRWKRITRSEEADDR